MVSSGHKTQTWETASSIDELTEIKILFQVYKSHILNNAVWTPFL